MGVVCVFAGVVCVFVGVVCVFVGVVYVLCGNLHLSMAPSALVLMTNLLLGHKHTLLMLPLWPTPTCVTSPSS